MGQVGTWLVDWLISPYMLFHGFFHQLRSPVTKLAALKQPTSMYPSYPFLPPFFLLPIVLPKNTHPTSWTSRKHLYSFCLLFETRVSLYHSVCLHQQLGLICAKGHWSGTSLHLCQSPGAFFQGNWETGDGEVMGWNGISWDFLRVIAMLMGTSRNIWMYHEDLSDLPKEVHETI